ncbi:hypothetical protein [Mucilaginibacter gotjawali]|nr:hypothetical protein [Mucilaginibacter gotjawali]MBB3055828.1 hypothetical protein [Mucilaginibacter gotjawali]
MAETKNTGRGIPKTRLDYNDPMLLLEVEGLARDGYDDQQIAEILNVAPETFSKNKNKKQADGSKSLLSISLTKGRRPLSVLVENSLYKRAIGQKVVTTKVVTKREYNDQLGRYETNIYDEITETELPGDVNAQIQWLKCHKPDIYNVQPIKVDVTSAGNELKETPRIGRIEHVVIAADQVKTSSGEDDFIQPAPARTRVA